MIHVMLISHFTEVRDSGSLSAMLWGGVSRQLLPITQVTLTSAKKELVHTWSDIP